jgi:hypothetical protein
LAELWQAIGDDKQAEKEALLAYKEAWADGEPFVNRYELDKARKLLEELNVDIPELPPYDPTKDEKFPWENKIKDVIEQLRLERKNQPINN